MKPVNAFPGLLHAFFYERLVHQLNVSPHTVRSYRDTWRLFLRFAAERHKRPVAELTLTDLTAIEVAAFLQHSEQARKVSIGTRNCRLAAQRSFYGFVAEREPTAIAQCAAVRHIPTKKAPTPAAQYLEPNEIEAILAQPDRPLYARRPALPHPHTPSGSPPTAKRAGKDLCRLPSCSASVPAGLLLAALRAAIRQPRHSIPIAPHRRCGGLAQRDLLTTGRGAASSRPPTSARRVR